MPAMNGVCFTKIEKRNVKIETNDLKSVYFTDQLYVTMICTLHMQNVTDLSF